MSKDIRNSTSWSSKSGFYIPLELGSCKQLSSEVGMPDTPNPWQGFDFLEFGAGKAVTSTVMSHSGRDVAALDIDYYRVDAKTPNDPTTMTYWHHPDFCFWPAKKCSDLQCFWMCLSMDCFFRRVCTGSLHECLVQCSPISVIMANLHAWICFCGRI